MTAAKPYAYWTRDSAYTNAFTSDDLGVYSRNVAIRSVEDLHVRTYMHTFLNISTSTTSPPPKDWPLALRFLAVAGYSPVSTSSVPDPSSGDPSILCTSQLQFTGLYSVASPGVNVAGWCQQKTESARVFRSAPADNSDYPCVQGGLSVYDNADVLFPPASYHYDVRIYQYIETLWASDVPPS